MLLAFTLTMPRVNTWNGRWTGEGQLFVRVINVGRSKKAVEKAFQIIEATPFRYDFGDGWVARIDVREVDAKQARALRKASQGFWGYDWMITSIQEHLEIRV